PVFAPFFLLIFILILVWMFFARTAFGRKPVWQRIVALYLCSVVLNLTLITGFQKWVQNYCTFKYELMINNLALAKLPSKPAAIEALNACDTKIKAGIAQGQVVFKPIENLYSDLIVDLNT
ncbi:hypothetical protein EB061_12940, partial [bacterium]|nr:hypothetical protein [bacterium]